MSTKSLSMRDRFAQVVSDALDANPRVSVVLADISADRFVATGAAARHPHRVINVGIREQLMVSVAAGMALEGMRPVAHSFAPFLIERAFEQVKLDFSHQGIGGILVSAGASYDTPGYGRTHHGIGDVAVVASLPGWRIHIPGHADEVEHALLTAIDTDEPVYIRLSDQANAAARSGGPALSSVRVGSPGAVTVIAVGPMLDPVTEALADIDATILYASSVRPFDAVGLRAALTGTDVVLVEPYLEGTTSGEVSAALSDRPHRLLAIGVPPAEHRHYGTPSQHARAYGLDALGLRQRITTWLAGPA